VSGSILDQNQNQRFRFLSLFIFLIFGFGPVGCQSTAVQVADLEQSSEAMVVSADPLATAAGVAILKKGGNAIDAAVATTFAISVVEPFSAGIGGGGFLLVGFPPQDTNSAYTIQALDFRERAPKAATRDMYLDGEGNVIPRASLDGHLAAGVPGTVAGLYTVHRYHGQLPWEQVVEPAIRLAEEGFSVGDYFVNSVKRRQAVINQNPAARAIFTKDGAMYQPGEVLRQPDLANTLKAIAQDSQQFYTGDIAEAIATDMKANGGLITTEDLAAYTPIWREPVCGEFRQAKICSMPPPSSGGVHLLQILSLIEETDLNQWGRNSPETLHLLTEAMRIAYADRAEYLGDPDFVEVPVRALTSPNYLNAQRQQINLEKARPSDTVKPMDETTLNRYLWESPETSHLTVVDQNRTVVSLTFTVNGGFGAGVVAAGTGILLNNEMDDFAVAPGVPNLFGLVGGEANAIAPFKTPLSSMTPTIVTQNSQLMMAAGSPGGSTIITTVLQLVLNVLEFNMNAAEAVSAPRIHHQWLPDTLLIEQGKFENQTLDALKQRGHQLRSLKGWGNANLIRVTPDGTLEGAADPRRDGAAQGF
jgi:gamma-glutamyltranspeptidase/glutathione hydrolase